MQARRCWLGFSHLLSISRVHDIKQHSVYMIKHCLLPRNSIPTPPGTMRPACALPPCSGGLSRSISTSAHAAQWPAQMSRHGAPRRAAGLPPALVLTTCNTSSWPAPPPTREATVYRFCTAASSTSSRATSSPVTHARTSHADASPAASAERQQQQQPKGQQGQAQQPRSTPAVQPVDFSTLAASCAELRERWVPAKVEQVLMSDKTSLCLRLRTPSASGWLRLCWHPVAGRVATLGPGEAPERGAAAELYTLAEQVSGALAGRVLVGVSLPCAWERVAALAFGVRPGEPPTHTLYCEVMARYSNIVLTDEQGTVLAAAYQVGGMMSSHRQVQVGRPYALPPQLFGVPPTAVAGGLDGWRDTLRRAAAMAAQQQQQAAAQRQRQKAQKGSPGAAAAAAAHGEGGGGGRGEEEGQKAPEGRLVDGFLRAFHGVSPALVEELCGRAGVDPSSPPSTLDDASWSALHGQWEAWQRHVSTGSFQPSLDPDTGRYSVFGAYGKRYDSVHAMLEAYYAPVQGAEAHGQLHAKLAGVVAGAIKKARGKVRAFEQQLADSGRSEEVQRQADLITANLYRIPAGSATAVVECWDTGAPLTLALDPTKPPVASAEALYKKARKLRRAVDAVQPLLEEARAEVSYLEDVEVGLAGLKRWRGDASDMAALKEVQDELVAGNYMKPPPDAALAEKTAARANKAAARAAKGAAKRGQGGGGGKGGPGAAAAAAAAVGGGEGGSAGARRYTSPGGFTVLVGRNNKQNDVLSTKVAADNDLWLHVRGMPGSHVVVRVPPGSPPPPPASADVQFAADLAAHFSKAAGAAKADVILSKGAWVRKPKGAKPGAVMVSKELANVVGRPADSVAAREGVAPGA